MERNDAGTDGLAQGSQGDANEFSGSGSTQPNGLDKQASSFDVGSTPESETIRARARQTVGTAGEKLADVGATVRDKAGVAKEKLANALQSGAERLRERAHAGVPLASASVAGSTADGTAIRGDGRVAQVSDRLAGGMQATADWVREADIDGIKAGIEQQVKDHPGRTLLIAAGLGYLIGRAFRGGNQ